MRFLSTKSGTVHVVDPNPSDPGGTSCPVVSRALNAGEWKGRRSLSPEAALALRDCAKCCTHKLAKSEVRKNKVAAREANRGVTVVSKGPRAPKRAESLAKVTKHTAAIPYPATNAEVIASADNKGQRLALEHAQLAREHGWTARVDHEEPDGWLVTATKGDEKVTVAWVDGKVDYPRVVAFFPTHQFWLKNTTQWRRQVSLPANERPAKREGGRVPRVPKRLLAVDPGKVNGVAVTEAELPDDGIKYNMTSLPFPHDAEDIEIIDAIRGHKLYWRNTLAQRILSADVPGNSRVIRISEHPATGRRYVSFPEVAEVGKDGEILGGERSVAIDQMIKVR